jgi:hypothetical protein
VEPRQESQSQRENIQTPNSRQHISIQECIGYAGPRQESQSQRKNIQTPNSRQRISIKECIECIGYVEPGQFQSQRKNIQTPNSRQSISSIQGCIKYAGPRQEFQSQRENIQTPNSRQSISSIQGCIRYEGPRQEVSGELTLSDTPKQSFPIGKEAIIEWQCNNCTLRNPIFINLCEICGTSRIINAHQEWLCKACTFINPLFAETCGGCGPEAFNYEDTKLQKNNPKEEKKKEECPICFEEEKFQKEVQHLCSQCNQAICQPCYQSILKSNNKACPLCRNGKY